MSFGAMSLEELNCGEWKPYVPTLCESFFWARFLRPALPVDRKKERRGWSTTGFPTPSGLSRLRWELALWHGARQARLGHQLARGVAEMGVCGSPKDAPEHQGCLGGRMLEMNRNEFVVSQL